MRYQYKLLSAAATLSLASSASATYLGFNSGSTKDDNSAKFKADWVQEFTVAQNLENAPGTFNAVRLYTNIQAYSTTDPIEAFDAAIETKTSILLGIWCSGTTSIANELTALQNGLDKHGDDLASLIIGISIGSEDLYRSGATGIQNKAGVGAGPDAIVGFINDYKTKFANTALASVPIGHVDTWDTWANSSNSAVLDAVDWIGVDEYPYYESGKNNTIDNAGYLFDRAYNATVAAANGKPVWVTETGWPTTGENWDEAVTSVENAQYYWQEIGCRDLFGKVNTFWYNLRDSNPDNEMKFAITGNLSTTPYFDLTCPTTFKTHYDVSTTESESNSTSSSNSGTSGTSSSNSASGTSANDDSGAATAVVSWAAAFGALLAVAQLL